ncbi:hypothetical protein R1sor_016251 [Riccia sorocarpa]|uniref:Uncharacterized protein n=1 Tax=Riccia sorocarpa TaxID=122646 RepID=A0ABD3HEH5_9MARC
MALIEEAPSKKECSRCQESLPVTEFSRVRKGAKYPVRKLHKECNRCYDARRRSEDRRVLGRRGADEESIAEPEGVSAIEEEECLEELELSLVPPQAAETRVESRVQTPVETRLTSSSCQFSCLSQLISVALKNAVSQDVSVSTALQFGALQLHLVKGTGKQDSSMGDLVLETHGPKV